MRSWRVGALLLAVLVGGVFAWRLFFRSRAAQSRSAPVAPRALTSLPTRDAATAPSTAPDAGPPQPPPRRDTTVLDGDFCSRDGWCWDWPRPLGAELTGVWAHGEGVWAIGRGGTVLRRHKHAWSSVGSDSFGELTSVWGRSADDVWVLALDGLLVHFHDGAWTKVTEISDQWTGAVNGYVGEGYLEFKSIWVSPTGHVFAVGGIRDDVPQGKEDDSGDRSHISLAAVFDGKRWELVTDERSVPFASVFGTSDREVWACTKDYACARWNGRKFRFTKSEPPFDMQQARHGIGPSSPPWEMLLRRRMDPSQAVGLSVGLSGAPGDRRCVFRPDRPPDDRSNECRASVNEFFVAGEDDVWAVGNLGVIEHWNGSAWAGTPGRSADANAIDVYDVWAARGGNGSDEAWAIGTRWSGCMFELHRRKAWTVVQGAAIDEDAELFYRASLKLRCSSALFSIAGRNARDGSMTGGRLGALHWNSKALESLVRNKQSNDFVSVLASGEAFVSAGPAILHGYEKGEWAKLELPADRWAHWLLALSPTDIWVAAGSVYDKPPPPSVLLHWDGTSWTAPFTQAVESAALDVWRDVQKITVSPSGTIWIASKQRVARIVGGDRLEAIDLPPRPLPREWVHGLWVASDDEVWVTGETGIWHWREPRWQREDTPGAPWGGIAIYGTDHDLWVTGRNTILHKRRATAR